MLAIGATDDVSAFHSEHSGIDWNVIFLLMGMMMIVGGLKKTGMFEYLAIWSVQKARAKPFRVMASSSSSRRSPRRSSTTSPRSC